MSDPRPEDPADRDGTAPPADGEAVVAQLASLPPRVEAIREAVGQAVVGQRELVDHLLAAVLTGGHVLLIGVPGVGKTLLARSLAAALGLAWNRIQFTPDLMPSDVLGAELVQEDPATGRRSLVFHQGPVFTQLLLADEINRTPPKTQAALLEAMAERQVTAAGVTRPLGPPFLVVATQNPIEQEGAYPLPEAQLDRFLFCLNAAYPEAAEERAIVAAWPPRDRVTPAPVVDAEWCVRAAEAVRQLPVADHVIDEAVALTRATRPGDPGAPEAVKRYVRWGAGPRAAQALLAAARAWAAMEGEPTASIGDIHRAAPAVLRGRLVLDYTAAADDIDVDHVVNALLASRPAQASPTPPSP